MTAISLWGQFFFEVAFFHLGIHIIDRLKGITNIVGAKIRRILLQKIFDPIVFIARWITDDLLVRSLVML